MQIGALGPAEARNGEVALERGGPPPGGFCGVLTWTLVSIAQASSCKQTLSLGNLDVLLMMFLL